MRKLKGTTKSCYPTDGYRIGMQVKIYDYYRQNYVYGEIINIQWDCLNVKCTDGIEIIVLPQNIRISTN